jgi:hypothetical protein
MKSYLFTINVIHPLLLTFNIQFKKREMYSHKYLWPLNPYLEDKVQISSTRHEGT